MGIRGNRSVSNIVLKGKKPVRSGAAPVINVVAQEVKAKTDATNSHDTQLANVEYRSPFNIETPHPAFDNLKELDFEDINNLKINHDNQYPLWSDGRDNESVERLAKAGLLKLDKDFSKITLTKEGNKIAEIFKNDDILPVGVLQQQTREISEKDIYKQSMVNYTYKGLPVISNSSFMDKWNFEMMEFGADKFKPEDKEIFNVTDLTQMLDTKNRKFKEQVEKVLSNSKKADTVIVPVGYREELHKLVMQAEVDGKPVIIEVPNNYYNYFIGKYGKDVAFAFSSKEIENASDYDLGRDISVSAIKDGLILGAMGNAFHISSPAEVAKIQKQLKKTYV